MNPSYLETIPLQKPDDGELDTGGGGGRDLPGEGEGPLRLPKLFHSLQLALHLRHLLYAFITTNDLSSLH